MNEQNPYDENSETAVIGCVLVNRKIIPKVKAILPEPDYFYNYHLQLIYTAVLGLYDACEPVDQHTVSSYLENKGNLKEVGGFSFITKLVQNITSTANVEHYANLVKEKYLLREIITNFSEITNAARQGESISHIITASKDIITSISTQNVKIEFDNAAASMENLWNQMENNKDKPDDYVAGLTTGFDHLDQMIDGLEAANLYILAGKSGGAKTSFALNITYRILEKTNKPVLFFSIEMSGKELTQRLTSIGTNIKKVNIKRSQKLKPEEWERLKEFKEKFSTFNLHINDKASITIDDIEALAENYQLKYGEIGLIIVDHIGIIEPSKKKSNKNDNRTYELGRISKGLKNISKNLNCPVLALSQLNRGHEQRQEKKPILSDIYASGEIVHNANVIMILDDFVNENNEIVAEKKTLHIIKNRDNAIGELDFWWIDYLTKLKPCYEKRKAKIVHADYNQQKLSNEQIPRYEQKNFLQSSDQFISNPDEDTDYDN